MAKAKKPEKRKLSNLPRYVRGASVKPKPRPKVKRTPGRQVNIAQITGTAPTSPAFEDRLNRTAKAAARGVARGTMDPEWLAHRQREEQERDTLGPEDMLVGDDPRKCASCGRMAPDVAVRHRHEPAQCDRCWAKRVADNQRDPEADRLYAELEAKEQAARATRRFFVLIMDQFRSPFAEHGERVPFIELCERAMQDLAKERERVRVSGGMLWRPSYITVVGEDYSAEFCTSVYRAGADGFAELWVHNWDSSG